MAIYIVSGIVLGIMVAILGFTGFREKGPERHRWLTLVYLISGIVFLLLGFYFLITGWNLFPGTFGILGVVCILFSATCFMLSEVHKALRKIEDRLKDFDSGSDEKGPKK